ncbi:MAG: 4Fe-4S dicluster domain-containing protein [bacterium]|nr:4Fe-4S dicluster domain-containing protein [bacterium]
MSNIPDEKKDNPDQGIPRRDFLVCTGSLVIGVGVGIFPSKNEKPATLPAIVMPNGVAGIPISSGYLLVDARKCQGCMTCMLACSLVHEGRESLSLSRIQVLQDSYARFPDDITLGQCRQCVDPACVKACPTQALHADREHGNVRLVEVAKCIGCKSCVTACPYKPSRALWNFETRHAQTCDLCADTPFWKKAGGLEGTQACARVCPVGAIRFSKNVPVQAGEAGYNVNLRGKNWEKLGYTSK